MLCACFFYSGFTLGLKNKPVIDPIVLMTYFSLSALIFSIPLLIIEYYLGLIQVPATSTAWLTILYIAFVPSFLAQIFFIRGYQNWGNRDFYPRISLDNSDAEVLEAFIGQFYSNKEPPKQIILSHQVQNDDLIINFLTEKLGKKVI